jgi:hypothetical protein
MKIDVGRKIALAVDANWYRALQGHRFLKGGNQNTESPTDLMIATIESLEEPGGMWVKPDERFSDFSKSPLFIPWIYVWSAVFLGPDEDKKLAGFRSSMT